MAFRKKNVLEKFHWILFLNFSFSHTFWIHIFHCICVANIVGSNHANRSHTHIPLNLCFFIVFFKNNFEIFLKHHLNFKKNPESFVNINMLKIILNICQNDLIKKNSNCALCVFTV
jgi:hypothetical protein